MHFFWKLLPIALLLCLASNALPQSSEGFRASIVSEVPNPQSDKATKMIDVFSLSSNEPKDSLTAGERVVVCVVLPQSGFISLWDAPPKGNIERLYPNQISHSSGEKAAYLTAGEEKCLGQIGTGYNIEITPSEGLGKGQFYLIVTQSLESMPDESDFRNYSFRFGASIVPEEGGYFDERSHLYEYFIYEVEEQSS